MSILGPLESRDREAVQYREVTAAEPSRPAERASQAGPARGLGTVPVTAITRRHLSAMTPLRDSAPLGARALGPASW